MARRSSREKPLVTDPDRVRLLCGPYKAPPLRRGDRATCLYRDTLVIITSWSSGPIPWPRCRALDSPGGGSGLLVDEELARAVRNESAAAVMHWWAASMTAVCHWRKALGTTRTDNQWTARLMLAAAEKGAEAAKERLWTEEERERCRQVNAEKGLATNLVLGYHGPLWAPEDIALLGTLPDEKVARRTGRTTEAVRQKREELGIPNPAGNRWREDEVALLGTLPDWEVSRQIGRSLQSVTQKRIKLGIANRSTVDGGGEPHPSPCATRTKSRQSRGRSATEPRSACHSHFPPRSHNRRITGLYSNPSRFWSPLPMTSVSDGNMNTSVRSA